MASSFIRHGDFGFWANDGFVEAMQLCLINEIESNQADSVDWVAAFKVELALQSFPMIYGGMSMELDDFLDTDERKEIVLRLIDQIMSHINSVSDYLIGTTMHTFRKRSMQILQETGKVDFKNENEFQKAVNDSNWLGSSIHEIKDRYTHSFVLLKRLILGQIKTTASSPIDYWNY
ncbi:MAG: hypothetical protein J7604_19290 [Sporocytophaga sp.]|uniref:hypothetical protein n=1 Tax=Sporocytophaga sp. TaxID=2231183 RepID=UPI001B1AD26B|nr:hypothetical protein [Sporocytophaga sp.]MBO9702364.1 hypothetical protein [Sporocytophaga sp.]